MDQWVVSDVIVKPDKDRRIKIMNEEVNGGDVIIDYISVSVIELASFTNTIFYKLTENHIELPVTQSYYI